MINDTFPFFYIFATNSSKFIKSTHHQTVLTVVNRVQNRFQVFNVDAIRNKYKYRMNLKIHICTQTRA